MAKDDVILFLGPEYSQLPRFYLHRYDFDTPQYNLLLKYIKLRRQYYRIQKSIKDIMDICDEKY